MTDLPISGQCGPLRNPGRFLLAFAVLAGLLLLAWSHLSGYYLAGLVAVANTALTALGVPLRLNVPAAATREIIHPGLVGAVALFAATPDRSLRWTTVWLGLLLAGLSLLHASLLVCEAWLVHSQSTPMARGAGSVPASPLALLNLAKEWGPLLAVVTTWFAAVRYRQLPSAIARRDPHPRG